MTAKATATILSKSVFQTSTGPITICEISVGLAIDSITVSNPDDVAVGDKITLKPEHLSGGASLELLFFGNEIRAFGSLGFDQSHDVKFEAYLGTDPYRTVYLERIFEMMRMLGSFDFDTLPESVLFFPNEASGRARDWLDLGALISTYRWKFQHEQAVVRDHKDRTLKEEGRRLASEERRQIGKRSQRSVLTAARIILDQNPLLAANDRKLAGAIMDSEYAPTRDGSSVKLARSTLRKHIRSLKDAGHLPKSP